jgi:Flp pilus assembly protein TadG
MTRPAWRRDRRGVAALEFALCSPLLLVMLAGLSDLGLAVRSQMQLASGLANAAGYTYTYYQTNGTVATSAVLTAIVRDTSQLTGATLTGPTSGCYCPSGSPVTLGTAVSCSSTCSNGAAAGTYVTIGASATYTPLMPWYGIVASTTLSDSTTVQVK